MPLRHPFPLPQAHLCDKRDLCLVGVCRFLCTTPQPSLPEFTSACSTSLFSGNMSCCSLTLVAQSQCGGTSSYNGLPLLWHCHWASTDGSAFPLLPLALGNAMTYNLHGCCSISLMGCLGNMVAHTPESSIRTEERVRASGMACSLLCLCLLGVPCLPRAVWRKYQPGKEEGQNNDNSSL